MGLLACNLVRASTTFPSWYETPGREATRQRHDNQQAPRWRWEFCSSWLVGAKVKAQRMAHVMMRCCDLMETTQRPTQPLTGEISASPGTPAFN